MLFPNDIDCVLIPCKCLVYIYVYDETKGVLPLLYLYECDEFSAMRISLNIYLSSYMHSFLLPSIPPLHNAFVFLLVLEMAKAEI